MKKVYLLSNCKPTKEQIEDLNRNFGNVEIIDPSPEILNFWTDVDNEIEMTYNDFCKKIEETIEDIKLKKADITWIEEDYYVRKIFSRKLKDLDISVIFSVKEAEFEEIVKEDGTVEDRIKDVKHVRFESVK